jgi:hypothetical protein
MYQCTQTRWSVNLAPLADIFSISRDALPALLQTTRTAAHNYTRRLQPSAQNALLGSRGPAGQLADVSEKHIASTVGLIDYAKPDPGLSPASDSFWLGLPEYGGRALHGVIIQRLYR